MAAFQNLHRFHSPLLERDHCVEVAFAKFGSRIDANRRVVRLCRQHGVLDTGVGGNHQDNAGFDHVLVIGLLNLHVGGKDAVGSIFDQRVQTPLRNGQAGDGDPSVDNFLDGLVRYRGRGP